MVRIFGTLIDAEGSFLENRKVTFEWVDERGIPLLGFASGGVIAHKGEETTDENGFFEINLVPNDPQPTPTYYKFGIEKTSSTGYKVTEYATIHIDGLSTDIDISTLLNSESLPIPISGISQMWVLQTESDGSRAWVQLPEGNSGVYDDSDVLKDSDTLSPVTDTNKILTEADGASSSGGTTDHTALSNIGTNTHAQIDAHIANSSNPHGVTKSDVGLSNVDNTSDLGKPISTAVANALLSKVNASDVLTAVPANADFTNTQLTEEQVQDMVNTLFQNGSHQNITVTYDDANNSISLVGAVAGGSTNLTQEEVEDYVGGVVVGGAGVSVVYSDEGNQLTISLSGVQFTSLDKSKLDNIESNANNYTHPTSHPASIIAQDVNNRFVTDTEIIKWNSKANGSHNHDGTYQPYDINTVVDANYISTDNNFTNTLKTNYDTAYGWGNHADAGYLTSETSHVNVATVNTVNVFTVAQKGSIGTITYGASVALDMDAYNNFSIALTGNITLANPIHITADESQGGLIILTQDATGGRTLTLGANYVLVGTDDADTTANKKNIYQYTVIDTTTILIQFIKAV